MTYKKATWIFALGFLLILWAACMQLIRGSMECIPSFGASALLFWAYLRCDYMRVTGLAWGQEALFKFGRGRGR